MSDRIDRPDFYPSKTLKRALDNIKPPPCERVSLCPHYQECARELKACKAFLAYVNNSSEGYRGVKLVRGNPTRHWYNEIYYNHRQE